MTYRIAINGYGRIGRCVLRAFYESTDYVDMRIVAINDLADIENLSHLTRYDSTHGRFLGTVETSNGISDKKMIVNGDEIRVFNEPDVGKLPWSDLDVDLVMECSGAFKDRETAQLHITGGAKKVLFSQPAENDVDATLVYGTNHKTLKPDAQIVSNASCTTNCIVPVLKAINETFKIESGAITTIHSAMNDQPVIDSYHDDDLRKTRSAMQSIIPVDTALAKGIERILPELTGLLEAQAIRVPTLNVSLMDLTLSVASTTNVEEVNQAILKASASLPANVLGFTDEPLASCDFNHDPRSAIVDLNQTSVANGKLIKLFVWFDNEWAYANRMLDVAAYMSSNK
ncbi:MAG: type I glyceraldehyde-3-phosphate dehydrogenase [Gammaproteobacteria bacterium]|jgi:D-erythrose 4-phosphate dehydrogenase|tara:strand:- start:1278 stop:2306 length:1029 start_codon:yes stop_codon:yes gene_type:complete